MTNTMTSAGAGSIPDRKKQIFVDCLRVAAMLAVVSLFQLDMGWLQQSVTQQMARSTSTTTNIPSSSTINDGALAAGTKPVMEVVSVSCGERFAQVVDLIDSIASRMQQSHINHYVFTEEHLVGDLTNALAGRHFSDNPDSTFQVNVLALPANPPPGADFHMWKRCASARLFLPEAFQGNNRTMPEQLVYIDTDAFVTTSLEKLWNLSSTAFQSSPNLTFMMAQETLDGPGLRRFQESPQIRNINGTERKIHMFPPQNRGFNSGVIALNMTAWQEQDMLHRIHETMSFTQKHNITLKFGDQGVLNYIAAQDESLWMELPCEWNLRMDTYHTCAAKFAQVGGGILHGSRQQFQKGGARLPSAIIKSILKGS